MSTCSRGIFLHPLQGSKVIRSDYKSKPPVASFVRSPSKVCRRAFILYAVYKHVCVYVDIYVSSMSNARTRFPFVEKTCGRDSVRAIQPFLRLSPILLYSVSRGTRPVFSAQ